MLFGKAFGQINKKDYYDYKKTRLMADYQVNAKGEKNGWFKGYDQSGILIYEYNYKNDQKDGVNKEYTVINGKREVMNSKTFKSGVLEGPATYYGQNGMIQKQGNFKNDKYDGKWTILKPYSDYNLSKLEIGNCDYVKVNAYYENDAEILEKMPDGIYKEYYTPCNKLYREYKVVNGKFDGEDKVYFPTGKINSLKTYIYKADGKAYIQTSKTYFASGKLQMVEDYSMGYFHFEEYTEDGSPTGFMKERQIAEKQDVKKIVSRLNTNGWNMILAKDYKKAQDSLGLAMKLDSADLFVVGNYAHSVLLGGDYDSAVKIYRAHMNDRLTAKMNWPEMIKQDYQDFKTKGIESESFDKILTELGLK